MVTDYKGHVEPSLPAREINLKACTPEIRIQNLPADPGNWTWLLRQTIPVGTHCVSVTWATEAVNSNVSMENKRVKQNVTDRQRRQQTTNSFNGDVTTLKPVTLIQINRIVTLSTAKRIKHSTLSLCFPFVDFSVNKKPQLTITLFHKKHVQQVCKITKNHLFYPNDSCNW